jgi:hypothetical protein
MAGARTKTWHFLTLRPPPSWFAKAGRQTEEAFVVGRDVLQSVPRRAAAATANGKAEGAAA